MLVDKFTNRGTQYSMSLYLNDMGTFSVTIKEVIPLSQMYMRTSVVEDHEFTSYPEACSKFRSVFLWNHGQQPSLPNEYDFYHTSRVVPESRVSRKGWLQDALKEASL